MSQTPNPASAELLGKPEHEATGLPLDTIDETGQSQIYDALHATADLEGDPLVAALMDRFGGLKERGELSGAESIRAWAEGSSSQNEAVLTIEPLPGVEELSDEERYRVGVVQTLYMAHVLGTPWRRHHENEGRPIQHVKPHPDHLDMETSIGTLPLWPHNEILPIDGQVVCSEFSTLFAVHNAHSGTPTTVYDAQKAIQTMTPEQIEVLKQPRFDYFGTEFEHEDAEASHEPVEVPMLSPVYDKDGAVQRYDLIADLDGKTMKPAEGDPEAEAAFLELRDRIIEHEIEYTIPDGGMIVWRNRQALHGRRPVTDIDRHLVRSQVGEAEYAG